MLFIHSHVKIIIITILQDDWSSIGIIVRSALDLVRTDYSSIDDSITWKLKNKYSITQKNGMTNNNKTMRIISGNCLKIMHPTIGVNKLDQYYSTNSWSHQQLQGGITNQKKVSQKITKTRISVVTPSPYRYSPIFQDERQQQHMMIHLYQYYRSYHQFIGCIE